MWDWLYCTYINLFGLLFDLVNILFIIYSDSKDIFYFHSYPTAKLCGTSARRTAQAHAHSYSEHARRPRAHLNLTNHLISLSTVFIACSWSHPLVFPSTDLQTHCIHKNPNKRSIPMKPLVENTNYASQRAIFSDAHLMLWPTNLFTFEDRSLN